MRKTNLILLWSVLCFIVCLGLALPSLEYEKRLFFIYPLAITLLFGVVGLCLLNFVYNVKLKIDTTRESLSALSLFLIFFILLAYKYPYCSVRDCSVLDLILPAPFVMLTPIFIYYSKDLKRVLTIKRMNPFNFYAVLLLMAFIFALVEGDFPPPSAVGLFVFSLALTGCMLWGFRQTMTRKGFIYSITACLTVAILLVCGLSDTRGKLFIFPFVLHYYMHGCIPHPFNPLNGCTNFILLFSIIFPIPALIRRIHERQKKILIPVGALLVSIAVLITFWASTAITAEKEREELKFLVILTDNNENDFLDFKFISPGSGLYQIRPPLLLEEWEIGGYQVENKQKTFEIQLPPGRMYLGENVRVSLGTDVLEAGKLYRVWLEHSPSLSIIYETTLRCG